MEIFWPQIDLDPTFGPKSRQLIRELRLCIQNANLPVGTRLPSTRELAEFLGISRVLVSNAYEILNSEGYLQSKPGVGTFINTAIRPSTFANLGGPERVDFSDLVDEPVDSSKINFGVCQPSLEHFALEDWRSCIRRSLMKKPDSDYGDVQGLKTLREQIAQLLFQNRNVRCHPDELIITQGAIQAFDLLASLFQGKAPIFFEEPGYRLARSVFQRRDFEVHPMAVTADGWQMPSTRKNALLYLTPSHQFPTGQRISIQQKMDFMAWARNQNGWIIEDDYDSEYRYDAPSIPAMASICRERIFYVGTFSKTLFPGLRIGFLLPPKQMFPAVNLQKLHQDYYSPPLLCEALGRFIREGYYASHLRKMKRIYASKHRRLLSELQGISGVQMVGVEAGLHVFLETEYSVEKCVAVCAERGLIIQAVEKYFLKSPQRFGFVLGFGCLNETSMDKGLSILKNVLGQKPKGSGK